MSLQISQSWTWSPTKISGCSAWFDAQDSSTVVLSGPSNVSEWLDKSGLSNNATGGTSPTYVAGSGVVFNGTSQYLTTAYTANPSAESLFIVATWTGTTSFTSYQLIGASANNGREYAARNDNTSNVVRWQIGGSTAGYGATAGLTSARFLTTGTYRTGTGGNTSLNGSNLSVAGAVTFSGSATTNIGVGYFTGLSNYFKGTINEIILYNREVLTGERQQVEGYLAYKWNLQSNLPPSHPYKINPPFQNTIILPTVPSGPILMSKSLPSAQFSGATNKISANVFTPLSLSNYGTPCLYWYDAQDITTITTTEDNALLSWNDKSGNGYNLTSNVGRIIPLVDAQNFTYMTGNGVLNCIASIPSPRLSLFIMYADKDEFPSKKNVFGIIPQPPYDSETSASGFIFESYNPPSGGAGPWETYFYAGGTVSYITNSSAGSISLTMFEYIVDEVSDREGISINLSSFVNGFTSNSAYLPGQSRISPAAGISLGGFYDTLGTLTYTPIGAVYEVIGVSAPVTEAARQKVVSYYAWKYGQKPNVPQDNPYLAIPPRGTPW